MEMNAASDGMSLRGVRSTLRASIKCGWKFDWRWGKKVIKTLGLLGPTPNDCRIAGGLKYAEESR